MLTWKYRGTGTSAQHGYMACRIITWTEQHTCPPESHTKDPCCPRCLSAFLIITTHLSTKILLLGLQLTIWQCMTGQNKNKINKIINKSGWGCTLSINLPNTSNVLHCSKTEELTCCPFTLKLWQLKLCDCVHSRKINFRILNDSVFLVKTRDFLHENCAKCRELCVVFWKKVCFRTAVWV